MYLSSLRVRQFRNYDDARFAFAPGVTVITGPNGSGKTNILEAIYIVATGSSFRDADQALTRYGDDWWHIQAVVDETNREIGYKDATKSIRLDDTTKQRLTKNTKLPIVLFEPDDLIMMHSSPQKRRAYLDDVTSITHPHHRAQVKRYERIVRQRNSVLKQARFREDDVFVWDIALVETAERIVRARLETIASWQNTIPDMYRTIAETNDDIGVTYHSTVATHNYSSHALQALKQHYERDRLTGSTSVGPHRDDIVFTINTHPAITHASRGEIRSIVIALKQQEIIFHEQVGGTKPLLLLDDVLSELDESRQSKIMYNTHQQTIITTTHVTSLQPNQTIEL